MSYDKTVTLPVSPDAAFELITRPERLRRWQTVAARVDLRVGGEYRWTITPGHNAAGTFTEIEPGKRVVFTWGWEGDGELPPGASTVSITLEQVPEGTAVRLVHEGLNEAQSASHAEGWNHYLERLTAISTTGDAGPDEWAAAPDPIDELSSAEAALAVVLRVLRGVTEEDLDKQTPCADFTVAQLVEHLLGSVNHIGGALGAQLSDDASAAVEVRIADAAQPTLETFRARGLEGTVDMGFAQLPAPIVANILNIEFLIHAWDLATATGQSIAVAPALSDYVLGLAQATITPEQRERGSFAEATVVDETASSLERLIAHSGRAVPAAN
ncbi:uncharacterized protein (TIGR03086 family) [Psychromicrobium silvestre]|uniref:Uncharacterized protein (TIGR03086 family) n=1 Tax=Psychromicrobium silvestre TaxID=1645614 RepID=A0A7Y9LQU0_9MICC|nr:TIGR03086 family metal-binding protein [Psychromicrobium silvestre]NYE93897.1 uncharacterized protein (TIGR03086 family) [Psychromicrobium silvestre]